jgi:hypothetical protein
MTNRVVAEFEEDIVSSYPSSALEHGLTQASLYQKVLILESRERYKLDLIVWDQMSNQFGVNRIALNASSQKSSKLSCSSLILSNSISLLETNPGPNERFVLGDLKVVPNIARVFSPQELFWAYLHLYGFAVDESTSSPALQVTFQIAKGNETVWKTEEKRGESFQYFSPERIVIARPIEIDSLAEGDYSLLIKVEDLINNESLTIREKFRVI